LTGTTPEGGHVDVGALESRMAELAEAYGRGIVSMAEWMRARAPLEEQLASARRARDDTAAQSSIGDIAPGALRDAWPDLTTEKRRAILGSVIDRVVIAPAERRARWDPDRVSITWRA
jgi:hypothetical protein